MIIRKIIRLKFGLQHRSKKITGRSCQSKIYPKNIVDNRDCILCSQCVKSCNKSNIEFRRIKNNYFTFDFNKLRNPELAMLTILSGFTCYEILSSWKSSKAVLMYFSSKLYSAIEGGLVSKNIFEAILIFIIFPLLFINFFNLIIRLLGKNSYQFYLKRTIGYMLPIVASGHFFKAILKTTSRIPYWHYAIKDSDGIYYAHNIVNKTIILNHNSFTTTIAIIIGLLFMSYAFLLSSKKLFADKQLGLKVKFVYLILIVIHFGILSFGGLGELY